MKNRIVLAAVSLGILATSAPALADDPNDPTMRNRAAREADAAEIRRLNLEQARHVQERDARYARSNERGRQQVYAYESARAEYEAEMEEWRRAVRLCRQGRYEYCR